MPWSEGYRKTSKKARRGRKRKPEGHKQHRKAIPSAYDSARAVERRRRLAELRALDDPGEDYVGDLVNLEPTDLEDAA